MSFIARPNSVAAGLAYSASSSTTSFPAVAEDAPAADSDGSDAPTKTLHERILKTAMIPLIQLLRYNPERLVDEHDPTVQGVRKSMKSVLDVSTAVTLL